MFQLLVLLFIISYYVLDYFDQGDEYMIPVCQDEISPRPAETDLIIRLHVEMKFRPGKAGQFSTRHLFRFVCNFFEFFCNHVSLRNWKSKDFH